jgi:hypothetical protein
MIAMLLLAANPWLELLPEPATANGKHVVLLAGDEEYRSEEALPQLAQILTHRHGFKTTVLFSVDSEGRIDPTVQGNQPGLDKLATADLCVMMLRFRHWPDEAMAHFVRYVDSGKPILALRTSTHAFAYPKESTSSYARYSWNSATWPGGFGRQVLGETWISHWGDHGRQATRGHAAPGARSHPVLRGVGQLFGTTDVYEAHPPTDCEVLMLGEVVEGLAIKDPSAVGTKTTALGKVQALNDPMMPIVWTRTIREPSGRSTHLVTTTMGSATDLLDENFRRLLVNATYWLCDVEVPEKADVSLVGNYRPSPFGFGGFRKGVAPANSGW